MKELNYLTDDEVIQLIESVEKNEMIAAPDYLKNTILREAEKKKIPKQHELFFFSAKIVAAAAAAIALLIVLPSAEQFDRFSQTNVLVREEMVHDPNQDSLLRKFNQKTNQFCSMISDTTNFIFYKEDE